MYVVVVVVVIVVTSLARWRFEDPCFSYLFIYSGDKTYHWLDTIADEQTENIELKEGRKERRGGGAIVFTYFLFIRNSNGDVGDSARVERRGTVTYLFI